MVGPPVLAIFDAGSRIGDIPGVRVDTHHLNEIRIFENEVAVPVDFLTAPKPPEMDDGNFPFQFGEIDLLPITEREFIRWRGSAQNELGA